MDLERERGITIKAQAVRLKYRADDGKDYILNLIDTPGHVDFTYEVSRSLSACEGGLLVVDATQGVEAQTLANVYMAIDQNLEVFPVLNKIDLPSAEPQRVKEEIEEIIGLDTSDAVVASAKEGIGIHDILEAIVRKIPPPKGDANAPLKALIFDSWYDPYQGVIILVRVIDGVLKKGDKIQLMANRKSYEILKLGVFSPHPVEISELSAGEVGFVIAGIKVVQDAKVGDTITHLHRPTAQPLARFQGSEADGFLRSLSDRFQRLRRPARRPGKTEAQRCFFFLRAGKFHGPWIRLSLRLSRPAAHGDHPGTAGAGIRR